MTAMERLDLLERQQLELARRCADLSRLCAQQAQMLASLLAAMAVQAEALPGERPLDQSSRARN